MILSNDPTNDLSLFKNVRLEELGIECRFASFNALNHPEYGFPNGSVTEGSSFGAITAVNSFYSQRQNHGAIKLAF